ncbi:hypothetical protein PFISCL1PPCAC_12784, partial [Pristionchus fissidentatus]
SLSQKVPPYLRVSSVSHISMARIGSCLILLLLLLLSIAQARRSDNHAFIEANKQLYFKLFENYFSHVSPYNTESSGPLSANEPPAELHMTMEYVHLTHVREVQMTHDHVFGMHIAWRDPRLTWNPADFGNISYIYVRSSDVWMPEISACESTSFSLIVQDRMQKAKVYSSGHIEFFYLAYASFICDFSVVDFPFDQHWCFYCFMLPGYSENELVFRGHNMSEQLVMDTSEWRMHVNGFRHRSVREAGSVRQHKGEIYFDFLISRRATFWVLLLIIPTYFLILLILLGLFFGTDANNVNMAVNFGLISFTSVTFIIGIIAGTLPKSQNISLLGWYILFELTIITLAVMSVFMHTLVCSAARMGFKLWTGENIHKVHPDNVSDLEQREGVVVSTAHRFFKYLIEHVLQRGRANFSFFFILHTLNLVWLLCYAFADPPPLPFDYIVGEKN